MVSLIAGKQKFRVAVLALLLTLALWSPAALAVAPKVYTPVAREHTWKEVARDFSIAFVIMWGGYVASQPDTVSKIQFQDAYENIFEKGAVLWDGDHWAWNFVGHPYVGSEFYLYYRSLGYAPYWAFVNTAIGSTIFEIGIETFSEPFSVNDFVITPTMGSALGHFREVGGLKLVNSDKKFHRFVGHVIYPETLLPTFERVEAVPVISFDGGFTGFTFAMRF